jgi:hypothetical protein
MTRIWSKAYAAQDALLVLLQDVTALADWHVDYGLPLARTELECWIDEQVAPQFAEVVSGYSGGDVKFTVRIWLYAKKTGTTAMEIRGELEDAADGIEAAIAADVTLGRAVMQAIITSSEYDSGIADAEARSRDAAMTIDVECTGFVG